MSSQFCSSPDQIGDLARLLGDRKYIPDFELMVHEFREASNKGMSVRRVSEHINGIARSSRKLRESIEALQRECGKDANWILEPWELCEHYSRALFEYQYSAPLPSGRPREGSEERPDQVGCFILAACPESRAHVARRRIPGPHPTAARVLGSSRRAH